MSQENIPLGVALAVIAAGFFTLNALLIRPALASVGLHLGNLASMIVGFLFISSIALVVNREAFSSLSWNAIFWFALIGLLNFSLGRYFYFSSINKLGPSRASTLIAVLPLISSLLALVFLDEKIAWLRLSGVLLVVAGVTTVVRSG